MRGVFSTDVSLAALLALITLSTCLAGIWITAGHYVSTVNAAFDEKTAIEAADVALKKCYGEAGGAALCDVNTLYSHEIDERALQGIAQMEMELKGRLLEVAVSISPVAGDGTCVRRPAVLQGGNRVVFVQACVKVISK